MPMVINPEVVEIQKDEIAIASAHPDFLPVQGYLTIKTKDSQLVTFKPNKAQLALYKTIKKLQKENKPVRIWVLKARQEGISTATEGYIFSTASQQDNKNCLIMADEKEHSNNLFEMSKLFHDELAKKYPHLAPKLKKSNEKKLEFEGRRSVIIIATADNTEASRSHTFHIVHLSEVAFFRDMNAVMLGLNQTVPDLPNTAIIGETTANGMNQFYDEWCRAVEGKTSWTALFIPWFWLDEYSLPLRNGEMYPTDGIIFNADTTLSQFLDEEKEIAEEYGLTPEQLNWRRYKIVDSCQGKIEQFKQEYPICWEEAFQMTGSNFFNTKSLERQLAERPKAYGEVFEDHLKFEFRAMKEGRIKIYEYPDPKEQYLVTADASEALGIDEASILVLNKRLNSTAAVVNGMYTPEDLAHLCIMLGNYYNKCMIAPENKGYGYMVCQLIFKKYGNIYRRKTYKTGEEKETEELGYNTNSITRPEYLGLMAEEVAKVSTDLKDGDLISQCRTFIINPKSRKAEAVTGKQDGLVICRAIAGKVRQEYPYNPALIKKSRFSTLANKIKKQKNGGFGFGG